MHQRKFFRILIVAVAIVTIALVWQRPFTMDGREDSCQETLEPAESTELPVVKLPWESLPNQFFSSF
ncbi:MAG: hypothetical protein EOO09_10335 [Chitinophagaceae bacterium]|nr:MAG: hypothetical protein EOO09_10335 [Chitinophagaceae bacterium]